MNLINFTFSLSKTQYDVYKYKLDSNVSYNKRKVYRYRVKNKVYDLRTEKYYKYLINVEVSKQKFNNFKSNNNWEYIITNLNLLEVIIDHIQGFLKINSFSSINLPEELEELIDFDICKDSNMELNIHWFKKPFTPKQKTLDLVIFDN